MTNNLVNTLYEESQDNPDSLLWQAAQKLEQAEARVAELEACACDDEMMCKYHGERTRDGQAWLLRKQAEAVEAANDSLRNEINDIPGSTLSTKERHLLNGPLRHIERYAQHLRQQADDAENG